MKLVISNWSKNSDISNSHTNYPTLTLLIKEKFTITSNNGWESLHQKPITDLAIDFIEPPSIISITEDGTLSIKEVIKKEIQSSKKMPDTEEFTEVPEDTKPIHSEDGLIDSKI